MAYRIIQWGTGNVGKHALRTIVDRPDYELVGLRVYNPEKVGIDAGELLGRAPLGVTATDSIEDILAIEADCVSYNALGTTADSDAALDDICRLLASSKNVVSSAVEFHAYLRPEGLPDETLKARKRIMAACDEGKSSFFHVGINPGFAMDAWPIMISRVCRRIDHLTATEIVDMSGYSSSHMVFDALGFGQPADYSTGFDTAMRNVRQHSFFISLKMIADVMGVDVDDVTYSREVALAEEPLTIAAGTIDAGTVAAMRFRYDGFVNGREAIRLEWVWRVSDKIAPDWPAGEHRWLLKIEGDPTVESELKMETTEDAGRATSLAVATLVLNAVPTVCAADPGPLDNLTIPTHAGGYFA